MVEDVDFFIVSKPETMKEMGAAEASIRFAPSIFFLDSDHHRHYYRIVIITEIKLSMDNDHHTHQIINAEIIQLGDQMIRDIKLSNPVGLRDALRKKTSVFL